MKSRIISLLNNHKGKDNAIFASEISKLLGISETEQSSQVTRSIIREIVNSGIAPIASCRRGYFMVANDAEVHEQFNQIQCIIDSLKKRQDGLFKGYRKCSV